MSHRAKGRGIGLHHQVGTIAAKLPSTIDIFERHGIKYCCDGEDSIDVACGKAGVSPVRVIAELSQELAATQIESSQSLQSRSTSEIIGYIEEVYHKGIRQELTHLNDMVERIANLHVDRPETPLLFDVICCLKPLTDALNRLMRIEENELFPRLLMANIESRDDATTELIKQSRSVTSALEQLRLVTSNFEPPIDSCMTMRTLWSSLEEFDAQVRRKMHLVKNVLNAYSDLRQAMSSL